MLAPLSPGRSAWTGVNDAFDALAGADVHAKVLIDPGETAHPRLPES